MKNDYSDCYDTAKQTRLSCLRMVWKGQSGHIGSMLSCAEILAVLYNRILNCAPDKTKDPNRDRLIFSKGHGGAALFATLAQKNYFPVEWLDTYYQDAGKLSGHISHHVNGVEFSTGSLGHGLPVACGMALFSKRQNLGRRIFCICSDGDLDEGSSWEAIMLAGQHKFNNLCLIIDYNRLQALGRSRDIINFEGEQAGGPEDDDPNSGEGLAEKLRLFKWETVLIDGHDCAAIDAALAGFPKSDKPYAVICRTTKGKGVSFMENNYNWHYGPLTTELYEKAVKEVEEAK